MNTFTRYLADYFRQIPAVRFLFTTLFVAVLITINYTIGIENRIRALSRWPLSLAVFFIFYFMVFATAYLLQPGYKKLRNIKEKKVFIALLFVAPALFALKAIHWQISLFLNDAFQFPWNKYYASILQLPVKLLFMLLALFILWKLAYKEQSFFGFTTGGFKAKPYLLVLICIIPLIAFASTQADFLHTYPKVKNISFLSGYAHPLWPWKLLYEISYGMDFASIELFFRGFLVLGFVRFAGVDAILPMAAFYCTIHFGKPLGECISSYAGGLALGVIVYRTKSIMGGLIVHLGLAWLMEIGGMIGQ